MNKSVAWALTGLLLLSIGLSLWGNRLAVAQETGAVPAGAVPAGAVPAGAVSAGALQTEDTINKLADEVQQTLAVLQNDEMTTVIVTLRERADITGIRDRVRRVRLRRVIQALQNKANTSQRPLRQLLRARRAQGKVGELQYFWVFNGLMVTATADVIQELAALTAVQRITPNAAVFAPSTLHFQGGALPEPNVALVNAPALWDLGWRGQGVVVANFDTGVDLTHPDLASKWRGGANSWFDPSGEHATPADVAGAASGHGTWTMGVMVGGATGGTAVGIAPDARWIAAKIFNNQGSATVAGIHAAFQWLLDPDGDPLTDDAPHVVNHSWTYQDPGCNLEFQDDLQALRVAGIVPVFAAGNAGPGTESSISPSNNPAAFAVGGVNNSDQVYTNSSRGPSACGEPATTFPELVAPGVNIQSTDLFGLYTSATGTSLAAPHAAGALALLLSSWPDLTTTEQEQALIAGAVDLGSPGPDNDFGAGRLDVLAAYQSIAGVPSTPTATATHTLTPTVTITPTVTWTPTVTPTDTPTNTLVPPTVTPTATPTHTPVPPSNQPPSVNPGPDQAITLPSSATLDGAVTDDGLPTPPNLTTSWSQVSGPGTTVFGDANAVDTTADFSVAGVYTLRLTANDGAASASADVTITVNPAPVTGDLIYVSSSSGGKVGGVAFQDEDITVYDTASDTWALVFDGSDVGVGNRDLNGFTFLDDGSILMTFDNTGNVPGVGAVDDSDIVQFTPTSLGPNTAGSFSIYFDGSDVDLSTDAEDIDALHALSDGRLLVSTLGNFSVSGVSGKDEDILIFTLSGSPDADTTGSWELYFDASDVGLTAGSEDIWGIWSVGANADLYLSTSGNYAVPGLSGDNDDIFVCTPGTLGDTTTCTFRAFWDGDAVGYGAEQIDGFGINDGPMVVNSASHAENTVEADGAIHEADDEVQEDIDEATEADEATGRQHEVFLPLIQDE